MNDVEGGMKHVWLVWEGKWEPSLVWVGKWEPSLVGAYRTKKKALACARAMKAKVDADMDDFHRTNPIMKDRPFRRWNSHYYVRKEPVLD